MKRTVIIHCWDGTPDYCWYPWTKQKLEQAGFAVQVPAMPDTSHPNMKTWVPKLQEAVGKPDQDLYLVGHSIGCATIMRYLEQLQPGQKVGGIVFVAGFTNNLNFDEIANYFEKPFDFEKIKSHIINGTVLIHSDNDQYVSVDFGTELKEKLDGELIILHNKGHFSGPVDNEESCTELPEVVEAIKKLAAK